jgi:ABC-type glycerol-3-phosphate transport system substrate-binding protein
MTRRTKFRIAPALAAVLSLTAAGCTGGKSGGGQNAAENAGGKKGIEITFWHTQTQENKVALEALCDKFNKENKDGITVRPLWQGNYPQLYNKIMAAIVGKNPPDVAVSYESMVAEYMKANAVAPLDPYVNGPNGLSKEDLNDIFPAFLATNRFSEFGGQMLSFPFTKSLLVNYVNMDALKRAGLSQPPATWDDFVTDAVRMTHPAQGEAPASKGVAVDINASTIDGWIMAQGGTLLDSSGANFDSPEAHTVFQGIADLIKKGAAYQTQGDTYMADFGAQRAGMVNTSSTQRTLFKPLINNKFAWKLAMIPQKNPQKPVTVLYGANLCIFKSTPERQAAAWKFLRWLSQKDQAAYWAIHSSYMPIRKSVAQTPEMQAAWKSDPQGEEAFDLLPYAKPEPNVRGWQEVRDLLTAALQSVISGAKTPDQALKELDRQADRALAEKKG